MDLRHLLFGFSIYLNSIKHEKVVIDETNLVHDDIGGDLEVRFPWILTHIDPGELANLDRTILNKVEIS